MTGEVALPESLREGHEDGFHQDRFVVLDPSSLQICEPPKPFVTVDGIHGKVLVEKITEGGELPFAILALLQGYSCGRGGFSSERKIVDADEAKRERSSDPRNMIHPATAIMGIAAGVIVRQRVVHLDETYFNASARFHRMLEGEQQVLGRELLRTIGLNPNT